MKTVFVYANKTALSDAQDVQDEILQYFEGTALPLIAEHVVLFVVDVVDEDLSEYHQQVVQHVQEHKEADVFFHGDNVTQIRIVQELLQLSSEIIFH